MTLFVETEKTTPYFVPNRVFILYLLPKEDGGVWTSRYCNHGNDISFDG